MTKSAAAASSDAIDGFCVLAQQSTGDAAVLVIKQCIKHPRIFTFNELIIQPNIAALNSSANATHVSFYRLLQLFAYGTYADYERQQATLPALSQAELTKLRCLTVTTLASTHRRLSYALISDAIRLFDNTAVESHIIECLNAGLIDGVIDQSDGAFHVESAMSRDIAPTDIPRLIEVIDKWIETSQTVLKQLHTLSETANTTTRYRRAAAAEVSTKSAAMIEALKATKDVKDTDHDTAAAYDLIGVGGGGRSDTIRETGASRSRKPRTATAKIFGR